jgi:tetratricopeptide (TPR) repeat protein
MKALALCTMVIVFCVVVCQKKEQVVVSEPEVQPVEIELPDTMWQKTASIVPEDSGTVSRIVAESIVRRLDPAGLKIVSGYEMIAGADYIIKTRAKQHNDSIDIAYTIQESGNDSTLHQTMSFRKEQMLTALETVSAQVSWSLGDSVIQKKSQPVSGLAVQNFLEAEASRLRGTPDAFNAAIRQYKEILRNDSLFTDAWAGLTECYLSLIEQGWERNPIWLSLAQQGAFKLIKYADKGEGEAFLGRIALIRGDLRGAETYFRQALQKNKNLVAAWRGLGQIFTKYGLYEYALEMFDHALALNFSDLSSGMSKALILGGQGQYPKAIELLQKLISVNPEALYLHSFLALQLFYEGDYDSAMEAVRIGLADPNYLPLSHAILAMIQARTGDLDSALGEVELEVKPQAEGNGSLATAVAAVYSILGRKGQSVQWLEKAVEWGYLEYPWLVKDPNFVSLQGDKRFEAICDTLKVVYNQRRKSYLD